MTREWDVLPLAAVATIAYGKGLPEDHRVAAGRFPYVTSAGVMARTNRALFEDPTVVVGRKGTLGTATLFRDGCWPSDTTFAVLPGDSIDPAFLALTLEWANLAARQTTTTVPSLSREVLEATTVPLPSRGEQRRITELIAAADEAVRTQQDVVRATEQAAAAFLTEQLTTAAQHHGSRELGTCAIVTKGKKPRTERAQAAPGLLPYWSTRTLRSGAQSWVEAGEPAVVRCDDRGALLCWDGSAGEVFPARPGVVASTMAWIRSRDEATVRSGLLHRVLEVHAGQLRATARGTTIPHVTPQVLAGLPVPTLPLSEQDRLLSGASAFTEALSTAEARVECARQLRRQLLHDLLSGAHRIPNSYDQTPE